ncbi:dihydroorotate dehydrogenase electron transfer subunit [Anaerocolumna sedimenticola]|uniref:Dihydroorotate dehydrogenase B (NAD(+)), electron transfer subunit n=1 Tax=Anaerocolumna sedimenticola TaxID=2696063 RepID=A0A6P1TRL0_9FIRM|nr:dihydroorotate dehydrogenase electron transfer subunit [Anaerocolumna sedimenticola]QHQ62882.1 dihydroorotate dehydrogenase electron transfer subunit [Anaerocolumna sedimenticola]
MVGTLKKTAVITSQVQLTEDVFSMWIQDNQIAAAANPGQFLSLYCKNGNRLLPRPISICEIDKENGKLRLVYRVVGNGTEEFSRYKTSDTIDVLGPLGNGFCLEGKKAILIGGGIGIPPMLELAKQLNCEKKIVLGYRDITFLNKEFETYGEVYISTENGSTGTKGNVIDAIKANGLEGDILFACGPAPMLRGVQAYAKETGIKAQLSMEERMACGIGACLACVCKSREKDHHTNVNNKRICKDGPVFYSDEIEI